MLNKRAVIADIGGTNARFAICDDMGEISGEKVVSSRDFFNNPKRSVENYLEAINQKEIPNIGLFAIAGPVFNGMIDNIDIGFKRDINELGKEIGFEKFDLVNDFVAQALCVPYLDKKEIITIGEEKEVKKGNVIAVMGPGTGLGASILVPMKDGSYRAVATEGGHVNAPTIMDKMTQRIVAKVVENRDYTCAEDLVSGRGLPNLYRAVKQINGNDFDEKITNPEITKLALTGDEDAIATFEALFNIFGTVAGNFAISSGAIGGLYIAGGILTIPEIQKMFLKSNFRYFFESKGKAVNFAKAIPTYIITHKYPAFLGLSGLAKDMINKPIF